MTFEHIPVLYHEVVSALPLKSSSKVLDVTCGAGGHSQAFLEQLGPGEGKLIGLDKDPQAREVCRQRLEPIAEERGVDLTVLAGDFGALSDALGSESDFDLIFADIGVSSPQIDTPERGFSYHEQGPLDMRMNPEQSLTAAELVNSLPERELRTIIKDYGEERFAGRVARRIVERRKVQPFAETLDLADTIIHALPPKARRDKHPARRTFQALRIAVNDELAALESFLDSALDLLVPGGVLAVISFHSLEDRIVKQTFRAWLDPCDCPKSLPCVCGLKPLGSVPKRQGWTVSTEELEQNPRARSARLRTFVKGGGDDQ